MYLKLNDYQFKTSRYRLTYMNSIVTTNQICSVGTQDQKERNTSIPLKKNDQTTREETKRKNNREELEKRKKNGKQVIKWQ